MGQPQHAATRGPHGPQALCADEFWCLAGGCWVVVALAAHQGRDPWSNTFMMGAVTSVCPLCEAWKRQTHPLFVMLHCVRKLMHSNAHPNLACSLFWWLFHLRYGTMPPAGSMA